MIDTPKKSRKALLWMLENNYGTSKDRYIMRIGRLEKYPSSKSFYIFINPRKGEKPVSMSWIMHILSSWLEDHDPKMVSRMNIETFNRYNTAEKGNFYLFVEYWKDGRYPYDHDI